MKNNIETPSYSIHQGGYHKEKHLMLKMQNNFQDYFLDSILFDPDKTDRAEFFESYKFFSFELTSKSLKTKLDVFIQKSDH